MEATNMFDKFKFLAAAAVASVTLTAGSAQAVTTVSVGDNILEQQILQPGTTSVFDFIALERLKVRDFILQATGFNAGQDVQNLIVEVTGALGTSLATLTFGGDGSIVVNGNQGAGTLSLVDQALDANDTFSISVTDGVNQENVGLQLVFDATAAPIPLPAGGVLLGSALLIGGVAARRRKETAAA
jgi:hypothetical protein